jgi:hypothetical protein
MISTFLSFPIMLILSIIQTVAVSRVKIMGGSADLVLLAIVSWGVSEEDQSVFFWALVGGIFISYISAMPASAVVTSYLVIAGITRVVQKGLWQSPILAILLSSFIGTIVKFVIDIIALKFMGIELTISTSIKMTLAPNLILNLFILFPVYLIMSDIANWISPKEGYEG